MSKEPSARQGLRSSAPSDEIVLVLYCLRSGGAEKQLLWIASAIVATGRPCTIFELASGERTERIEAMVRTVVAKGVRVLRAPAQSGNLRGLWRLRRYLEERCPALIWSWGLRADGACYLCRALNARARWVISIRNANVRARLEALLEKFLAGRCDGVIANTHAGWAISRMKEVESLPYWVLPNAVAFDQETTVALPAVAPDRLVLVMLGNIKLVPKGYDLAARLARTLRDKGFPFELRIAGRPDELVEFEAICSQLGVKAEVRFYGEVSQPEKFLCGGHLYLLLSRFEGMPNTLLEALSVGLPAIATEVGDLRVLKERGAPYDLIPLEDVPAAVASIEKAMAHWPETREKAMQGRIWVQDNFSEDASRAALQRILAAILKP